MTYKIVLPTMDEAKDHVIHGKSNPLDQFVYIIQPEIDKKSIAIFRDRLENALQYAIDEQESFRLTLDGADSEQEETTCIHCGKELQMELVCPDGCPQF